MCKIRVQMHPDLNRGDPESKDEFLRLQDAYTVLSSTALRREYDQQLQRMHTRAQSQAYSSDFTGSFVRPKQSYTRSVLLACLATYR